jgi:hypothetical protein
MDVYNYLATRKRNILQIIIESSCTHFGHSESHEWCNVKSFFRIFGIALIQNDYALLWNKPNVKLNKIAIFQSITYFMTTKFLWNNNQDPWHLTFITQIFLECLSLIESKFPIRYNICFDLTTSYRKVETARYKNIKMQQFEFVCYLDLTEW